MSKIHMVESADQHLYGNSSNRLQTQKSGIQSSSTSTNRKVTSGTVTQVMLPKYHEKYVDLQLKHNQMEQEFD